MAATDAQVRKLMKELRSHGELGIAAARAGMDRKTGAKYRDAGKLPSEMKEERTWRTREDPFEAVWSTMEARLRDAPELEAKTLFEDLLEREPEGFQPGQLRTLQRRVQEWRAQHGPERVVFFAQAHRPGEAMQTDFTCGNELGITVQGEALRHLLCHPVLPYSNWEAVTVCRSESFAALRRGIQAAVFELGKVPEFHQTDNSTGATHGIPAGMRRFNDDYQSLMDHLGMKPRTIEVGESEQNGDVEALNGVLKRRLKQHLLVRGSTEFESVDAYERWVQGVASKANRLKGERLAEELAVMKALAVERAPEFTEEDILVTGWSTIRVKHNTYSVPSRLMGSMVRVRIYEDRLEVKYHGKEEVRVERLLGRNGHRINYRHLIWSLVQKPGAFALYRYREDLFPSLTFRRTYDAFQSSLPGRKGDLEYLRVLHLAASTMEAEVEAALELLLGGGGPVNADEVKALVVPAQRTVPDLPVPTIDLSVYDSLLSGGEEVAG